MTAYVMSIIWSYFRSIQLCFVNKEYQKYKFYDSQKFDTGKYNYVHDIRPYITSFTRPSTLWHINPYFKVCYYPLDCLSTWMYLGKQNLNTIYVKNAGYGLYFIDNKTLFIIYFKDFGHKDFRFILLKNKSVKELHNLLLQNNRVKILNSGLSLLDINFIDTFIEKTINLDKAKSHDLVI